MPIASADIQYRLSGGATNSTPLTSLGGIKSSTAMPTGIFDDVSGAESAAGDTEYRCVYVHNAHATLALQSAVIWIDVNTTAARIAIGAGSSAINGTEQTVSTEETAPTGVTFTQPATFATGIAIGNIPAGQHKAVWIRRVVVAGATANNDTFTLRVQGDTAA